MPVYEAHISGQVQGVGFRPFIYRKAINENLKGWVCNNVDGVHIRFNYSDLESAKNLIGSWLLKPPPLSQIDKFSVKEKEYELFTNFRIALSQHSQNITQSPCPDFYICPDCVSELNNPENRRFQYPFITCTNCGPRFSIMAKIPYDRCFTSMKDFKQCKSCADEYGNHFDRRFYSQTNSCVDCGIKMGIYTQDLRKLSSDIELILNKLPDLLNLGSIIAIKGIGGYLLLVDASNSTAIAKLRKRKNRPKKPFALMYPDLDRIKKDLLINQRQIDLLQSPVSPIVLLPIKKRKVHFIRINQIAPGLDKLGVMLPYAGLFHLIFKNFKKPLIATSANITNEPLVYEDAEALVKLSSIADYIITHNRPVVFPQDDSVYNSCQNRKDILVRRSRGLAPSMQLKWDISIRKTVLAFGAQLKSSFSVSHHNKLYVSQFLGNLEYFESQQRFREISNRFLQVLEAKPKHILVDAHPDYASTRMGIKSAQERKIPVTKIWHHKAHFAAVLAENNVSVKEKVLGVIWDGTGLGEDQQIWGGDFFELNDRSISRLSHFEYFDHLQGDQMAKIPAVAALSLVNEPDHINNWIKPNFKSDKWIIYKQCKSRPNSLKTSSVGRIFDGVAALLNLTKSNSFEGEAAMLLEVKAREWIHEKANPTELYLDHWNGANTVPTFQFIYEIIEDLKLKKTKEFIAAKFHLSLVHIIRKMAVFHHFEQIAFSGGVFQNSLLNELIVELLGSQFKLHFHKELSPNDECISYGQIAYAYYYAKEELAKEIKTYSKNNKNHVFSHTR